MTKSLLRGRVKWLQKVSNRLDVCSVCGSSPAIGSGGFPPLRQGVNACSLADHLVQLLNLLILGNLIKPRMCHLDHWVVSVVMNKTDQSRGE
ncbi:hypothetical protein CEXT_562011 [Caerostris extrusa]|uniref:Uncharacterized protein n=1 Tax=Caerostris extrusa TaxID=172846 RepID=A0AAV4NK92_CAEEX|nr:hypothetical protein CEXT_562011 [Caerostris extrusa]